MRAFLSATVLLACAFGFPRRAVAQTTAPDSLPFRRGQWAVEFPLNKSVGIGFLRFGSNRSALQLDARFLLAKDKSDASDLGSWEESNRSVDVRIGRRVYRPLVPKTAILFSVGVAPGWYRRTYSQTSTSGTFSTLAAGWTAGAFAEVGASYFVTPKLSLGALTGASGFYRFGNARTAYPGFPSRVSKHREYEVAFLSATIVGALYF